MSKDVSTPNQDIQPTPHEADELLQEHIMSAVTTTVEYPEPYNSVFQDEKTGHIRVYNIDLSILDINRVNMLLSIAKPGNKAIYFKPEPPSLQSPKGKKANLWIGKPKAKTKAMVSKMFSNLS
tara:strand:+ start:2253 stop:2621 length:369 start_codon:yes stop_codon:yes gene_type:complete